MAEPYVMAWTTHFLPEPGALAMLGCGAALVVALGRRRIAD
jgi:hypothetical protein